jgi:hypothetical protein
MAILSLRAVALASIIAAISLQMGGSGIDLDQRSGISAGGRSRVMTLATARNAC